MANQTGRPIAPARKLVAWIIGTIAVFVIALGLGMSSSPVAFFGVAVLAIAIAVAFMPAPRRGGRATVAGTAEVRSIAPPPVAGAYGRATIQLIVVAPGLGAFEATVREPRIPVEKWPLPGATVPITVDVDDTRRVRVSWRDAPARLEGDDPPPPPAPAGRDEPDDLDDEVFGTVDEPWQGRDDDWDVDSDGPGPSSGPRGATTAYARRTGTPVVVHETATGTIVEGHVVDSDEELSPLPRRARPLQPETTAAADQVDEPPTRPAPTARTATEPDVDLDLGPDDEPDWPDPEPPWRSPGADPISDTEPVSDGPGAPGTATPRPASTSPAADTSAHPASTGPGSSSNPASGSSSYQASNGPGSSSDRAFAGSGSSEAAETETAARSGSSPASAFLSTPQADPPSTTPPRSGPASGRAPGSRPSPRPRPTSATATVEREPSSGTAEVPPTATTTTATQAPGTVPPAQRTSTESHPDPAADIDLDLDGPPTSPVTAVPSAGIPAQSSHGRTSTSQDAPTGRDASTGQDAPTGRGVSVSQDTSVSQAAPEPTSRTGPDTPATDAPDRTRSTAATPDPTPADPVHPAGRSNDPVSPAGRRDDSIDPVSPAGRSSRGGARSSGLTPPPPPATRRPDAPTPPPPPVARPSHAAAPPPPPARPTRSNTTTRDQNAWARPTEPVSPAVPPTPAPRSPSSADDRWAAPARPVSPAPQPSAPPRSGPAPTETAGPADTARSGPADTARSAPTGTSRPSPTGTSRPTTDPGRPTAGADRRSPGPDPSGTARQQPGPTRQQPGAAASGSAWAQPAQRPAPDEERWAPADQHAAAAKVPPNVETRPLGSRTRFFAQPGEETESFETEGAEQPPQPQPRPEPTPTSTASTPSPVAKPPTAPEPDRPFPSAPPPATPRPTAPRPGIDQIDIPLDNFPLRGHNLPIDTDPAPVPEDEPQAAAARADGIVAPPVDDTPRPSALRDGILGVAVGRAAVSPDAFPTPHFDDVPAPGQAQDDRAQHQAQDEQRRSGPWGDFSGRPDERAGDVITGYPSARPASAGAIHGVGITVLVTDLERSTEFYRDVLGFHEIDNGDGSAVLASGDTRLVLRTVHNLTAEAGRLIYLNLEVGDIEAVHAELREKGVKFVHSPRPVNRGDKLELWSATFRDPDNHNIAITQWRAIH